ncbi:hypothetical protein [Streptomyces lydicus]|uniref:hypothetical protein n=1 Tax=Streptomyces lydicus TaxID=47763 RepID=UPI001E3AB3FF|nr:hypothetical protein [Streptomyces lydicus]MDC7338497.1 hypothetical protein [Streptomyces lydicus]UEG92053.1 hypothetical protein LJ741_16765 [Streptomyces lydicus]
MTRGDLGALAITAWTMSLWVVMMTATSQRRGKRTLLERALWKRAIKRAQGRRADLAEKIEASDLATLPGPTLDYVQREDVLFQASSQATTIKVITTSVLAFNAGGALFAVVMGGSSYQWREALACALLVGPIVITVGLNLLAMGPGMQRWTTEVVSTTARRSYEALLAPFQTSGAEPETEQPYHAPHIPAVRALEDFALSLEKYAVKRALPDGQNPMPQVVRQYAAAAAHIRTLRDGIELEREDGRKQALLEVERMLTVLAGPNLRDLVSVNIDDESLLSAHRDRTVTRRRTLTLAIFTLALVGIVTALLLSSSALGVAVATVVTTFVVASWGKNFGLSPSQEGGGASR